MALLDGRNAVSPSLSLCPRFSVAPPLLPLPLFSECCRPRVMSRFVFLRP